MMVAIALSATPALADQDQTAQQLRFDTQHVLQQREQAVLVPEHGERATVLRVNGEDFVVGDNVQELARALLVAVNHGQAEDAARLLRQYRRLPDHDAALVAFVEASISRLQGDLRQANHQYATLLAEEPDFVRARLDWARTLFDNRHDAAARIQFSLVGDEHLPAAVQKNVQGYLRALEIRNGWHASLSAGVVHNSNVADAAGKTETMRTLLPTGDWLEYSQSSPQPQAAHGLGYEASVHNRYPLVGHHALVLRGLLYGTRYRDYSEYSDDTANLAAGYQWASARHSVSLTPLWEWGRNDNQHRYRAAGVRAEWQYNPSARLGLGLEAESKHLRYAEAYQHNNGQHRSLYATVSYAPAANWWWYSVADVQWRQTQEKPLNYRQHGLRVGVLRQWDNGTSLNAHATVRWRDYAAYNPWLQVRRQDREHIYAATVKVPRWQTAGFSPTLTFRHTRAHSNADWFAGYRKNEIMLKWERFF